MMSNVIITIINKEISMIGFFKFLKVLIPICIGILRILIEIKETLNKHFSEAKTA